MVLDFTDTRMGRIKFSNKQIVAIVLAVVIFMKAFAGDRLPLKVSQHLKAIDLFAETSPSVEHYEGIFFITCERWYDRLLFGTQVVMILPRT